MNLRGLYAIADRAHFGDERFEPAIEAVLSGGATLVQYRDKTEDDARRYREATALVALCHRFGAGAIINDDPALAAEVGADGVHLGADDTAPATARAQLGAAAIIGVTCKDQLERARAAAADGADYVAFGRLFPSTTKPGGPIVQPDVLGTARRETGLAVCAIGGLTAERAPAIAAAGADLIAVSEDLFGAPDITARARQYQQAFA